MQSRSATSCRLLLAASASSLVFGCAPLPREPAVPPDYEAEVTVLGLKNIRYWGDEDSPEIIAMGKDAYERELAAWRRAGNDGPLPEADFLAVSGGGEDGAFGAGLLCGWSETGQRPQFKLVTGISTGALTAPFAFLGPQVRSTAARGLYWPLPPRCAGGAEYPFRPHSRCAFLERAAQTNNSPLPHADDAQRCRHGLRTGPAAADRHDQPR